MKFLAAPALAASLLLGGCLSANSAETLTVDATKRYQRIEGFGTCLISWGNFPSTYDADFARTYVEEMGGSLLRVELSGGSLPTPIENPQDIRHQNFKMSGYTGSTEVFVKFAQELKKLDPDIKIIGTVWTPPPWMKHTNDLGDTALAEGRRSGSVRASSYRETKNYVKKENYPHMVQWLVEFAKLYKEAGVPLYAISPGNEVMFTQWFQSNAWTAEDYATIVAMLGEALEKNGMGDIKIYGPETMTSHNQPDTNLGYLAALRANPTAWRHLDAIATHGYTDGFTGDVSRNSSADFWNIIKDDGKPYWMTEGGTGPHNWPAPLNHMAAAAHNSLVSGHASVIAPWQISEARPSTHGLMVGRQMTKKSHTARHYFKFIRPGAERVEISPSDGEVKASAFLHDKNKTLTVVLVNPTDEERNLEIGLGDLKHGSFDFYQTSANDDMARKNPIAPQEGKLSVKLQPQSIVTLYGK